MRAVRSLHLCPAVILGFLALSSRLLWAQQVTGTPPFGSFSGGPFDTVNNANLDVHFQVPIYNRAGRGLSFSYALAYDTAVWYPFNNGTATAWTPAANWGWTAQTQPQTGYLTFRIQVQSCIYQNTKYSWDTFTQFAYWDQLGARHFFPGYVSARPPDDPCGSGGKGSATITANDGSGYTLTANAPSDGTEVITEITDRAGIFINAPQQAPSGSGSVIDNNGNQITVTSDSTTSFYDTLSSSIPVLTMSGSGTPSSPTTYSYTNPAGDSSSYEVNYTDYSVRTNFGCSGVAEYSNASVPLVSSIRLPDGTAYSFTYEATPAVSGSVTGRLHSVTLPTGGTMIYTYTGGNNGIVCADGSAATLTRATPDGTWTYAHSEAGNAWTTTMTDPQANQTLMQFQAIYETERKSYQGSTSGTLLQTLDTCYNASASPCVSTAITLPIAQVSVTASLPGSSTLQSRTVTDYNAYGLVTERDEYGFGTGAPGALTRKSTIAYDTSLTNGIFDHPSSVQIFNGSGTLIAQSLYSYDQTAVTATSGTPQHTAVSGSRGNATTVQQMVAGSTNLVRKYTYFDTGNVDQATDTNNAVASYTYGDCGNSFTTSISLPLSLTTSGAWNCNGAVQTSVTDANGNSASSTFNDPNFWRPTATTDPTHAVTGLSYFTSPSTGNESTLNFNGNASTVALRTTLDGLGRTHVNQQLQSPGANNYDSVEVDYDSLGRPSRVTVPYTGTAGQTNSTASATKTTYDALGRPLTVTDGGGGGTTYTYTQNDVLIAIGPAPSGENLKRRQLEYDGLGRLTSVCEITVQTGAGNCGQTVVQTGYLTKYTYDALGNLLTVTQNAQSTSSEGRSYTYDGLSRLTSETNPESASKTYVYDSDSVCGASAGDQVKRVDAMGNVTCYGYDALHRDIAVTYPSGPYASVTPAKQFVYDAATVNGVAMLNAKGRLAEAYTGSSSAKITDVGLSYSARGDITDRWETAPYLAGSYYHVSDSFWENGLMKTLSDATGAVQWSYVPDGEGRVYSVSDSSGQQLVTSATYYSGGGQTDTVTFGSKDSDSYTYDANTGRMSKYTFDVNSVADVGTLTWNANGTLQGLAINNPLAPSNQTQSCTNGYDDLMRLISNNCGSVWAQTFVYDAFGNMSTSGPPSFQATYNLENHIFTLPAGTPSYDANGNLLNDGTHTYNWDAEGKNLKLDATSFIFDAFGNWTQQVLFGGTPIVEVYTPTGRPFAMFSNGTLYAEYAPLVGSSYAAYSSSGSSVVLGLYLHPDWLGTTRQTSNPARKPVNAINVSPYGLLEGNGRIGPMFFTGSAQEALGNDESFSYSDTWSFPARNFNAVEGRWLSPDPAGLAAVDPTNPQTWNRYAYVANNPLSNVDPSGMASCTSTDNCGLFVGSAPGPASWNDPRFSASGGPGGQYTSLGQLTASATPTGWNDGWLYGNSDLSSVTFSAQGLTLAPAYFNSDPLLGGASKKGPGNCVGGGGAGIGAGYNLDLGVGPLGVSSTAGVGVGGFHNSGSGSAGAFASGGATAYAGSQVGGVPQQSNSTVFALGAYAGVGANFFASNAASVQQLSGPFTTLSVNVGVGVANLGVQFSFGGGIWQLSVTPPIASVGIGVAGSVITTNTATTRTGCN